MLTMVFAIFQWLERFSADALLLFSPLTALSYLEVSNPQSYVGEAGLQGLDLRFQAAKEKGLCCCDDFNWY